jgi:hypothetical protein
LPTPSKMARRYLKILVDLNALHCGPRFFKLSLSLGWWKADKWRIRRCQGGAISLPGWMDAALIDAA